MVSFSLDGMEALEAIAEHGSFAAAAAHLHKTQSAISYAIRQLEDRLSVPLFDRTGHRARLTPEGVAVLDEGRFLLARSRRIAHLAARFREGWEPRLLVIADGALPSEPLMRALKALSDEDIPTHIQVRTEFLQGVPQRFFREGADLMIALRWPDDEPLEVTPLPAEELALVASPEHPVHAHDGPHDPLSLQRHLEVSVHDSSEETRGRDTNTIGGARAFYVSDFRTKRDALCMGLGFGWLPTRMIAEDLAAGRLREVSYAPGSRWSLSPALVHRTDRPLGRTGRRFHDLVTRRWAELDRPGSPPTARTRNLNPLE